MLTGATALAVGYGHTCAIMESGGVRCWGANDRGQLGNGLAPAYAMYPPTTDIEGLPGSCP